jgi:predicted TIM-barrel fold metal-dependent hydrolase
MGLMSNLTIISADGHCGAKPEDYRPYLEKKYWPALEELKVEDEAWSDGVNFTHSRIRVGEKQNPDPDVLAVIDDRGAIAAGGRAGAWDFERRLKELDADGIAGETLTQGHTLASPLWFGEENMSWYSAELRDAGYKAHHRWLVDGIADAGGRFKAFADPGPCLDMQDTLRELEWVAQHGFAAVCVPGILADPALPPLEDAYYEPFWSACADLGLRLFVHAGYGIEQGTFLEGVGINPSRDLDKVDAKDIAPHEDAVGAQKRIMFTVNQRRVWWELARGGVFDRHPTLKIALTELRAHWVPAVLAYLDERAERERLPLKLKPSEYFNQHCVITPSCIRPNEIALRHEIGVDKLMFGVDYPHPEGIWPNTQDWIRAAFRGVPEDEARLILGENAMDFFGFDRAALNAVAARIGPPPEDVLGEHDVDPAKIEHFTYRAGFGRPVEDALTGVDELFPGTPLPVGNS